MRSGLTSRTASRRAALVLALLAYLPQLLSHPGRLPADTKLGLTLDPAKLMATSVRSWDTSQFAGWVPHQSISYLWPSGPWYWLAERLGAPEWVAQRLWVGTVLFLGGLGVWWFVRRTGYSVLAAFTAALLYQLSPYVLPYVSRTSLMLLPWAGLGWLMGLTEDAARPGRAWVRPTALFGLVLATVGGINLTATLMIAPAPVLHLVMMVRRRECTPRRAITTAARLGVVGGLTSLWWLAMLSVQGHYGAKVLAYSETLEAVSTTSTAPEVLRGMGYWLAYVKSPVPTTTATTEYMTAPWLVAAGAVLAIICLAALVVLRFRERSLAGALLLAGVVLAVGAHPIGSRSPLMAALTHDTRSTLSLAIRSSTRAIPVVLLALALCAAAVVEASALLRGSARLIAPPLLITLALLGQPSLFTGTIVDPALLHDQRPPHEWYAAAATANAGDHETRVLQLPGIEFQAYDWGFAVDPPLGWMLDRQLVTRDLLPLGSPGAMDLLYAFDDRFQNHTADPAGIAPVARLLSVGTIWLANDTDHARYSSAAPDDVATVLRSADGLQRTTDGQRVDLWTVGDAAQIARAATRVVVVYGSGDGIVDAADAGLLHGDEAVLYAADLTDEELTSLAASGATFVVTDSNRDRAHQWRGSQDVWGFTETGGSGSDLLRFDPQDARLPVFSSERVQDQTTATPSGGLVVKATGYGSTVRYLPEYRPNQAVDGDPSTAWVVGVDGASTIGEQIVLSTTGGTLLVRQPTGGARITRIKVDAGGTSSRVNLAAAKGGDGQRITVPAGTSVTLTIDAVDGPGAVGFSELLPEAHPEVVTVPALRVPLGGVPFSVVVTRLRNGLPGRLDPETVINRRVETPGLDRPDWTLDATVGTAAVDRECRDDLVIVDGAPLPVRADAESAGATDSVRFRPCAGAPSLTAGTHNIVTVAAADVVVDRITITSAPDGQPVAATTGQTTGQTTGPTVRIQRGTDTHTVEVTGCPAGCWLTFGEGYSDGWSATSHDATLGRHLPIAGGFNGWWVQPTAQGAATITLHWAGQQRIRVALAASAVTVAVLMALALLPVGRRRQLPPPLARVTARGPIVRDTPGDIRSVVAVAMTAVVVAVLIASPVWGAACLAAAALAILTRRTHVIAASGWAVVSLGLAAVVGGVALGHATVGFAWPLAFERLHTPMMAAVALLAVGALAAPRDEGRG